MDSLADQVVLDQVLCGTPTHFDACLVGFLLLSPTDGVVGEGTGAGVDEMNSTMLGVENLVL